VGTSAEKACGLCAAGNKSGDSGAIFSFRWSMIVSITSGSSMQAMIRKGPPQVGQDLNIDSEDPFECQLLTPLQSLIR
jgi:hypothetical protein